MCDKGMKLLVETGNISEVVVEYQGSLVIRLVQKLLGSLSQPEWLDTELAASIYYSFYLPLPRASHSETKDDDEVSRVKSIIVRSILDDAGFWRVKPQTVVDRMTSLVASASILERVIRNMPRSLTSQDLNSEDKNSIGEHVKRAVSLALQQAEIDSKLAKSVESLVNSALAGNTSELAFEDVLEAILYLARRTDVAKVFEKLSGVKIPSRFARRTERFPKGWIEGIELGSDVERLHPTQLALPDEVFYTLYAESKLLLYKRVFNLQEGPIYVLLDKSGSMAGSKIDWARAVAIALFQAALRENRPFYVRFFDAVPHSLMSTGRRARPRDVVRLLEYLGTVKASGGTDITRAIAVAVDDIGGREGGMGDVDIVLITDGEDRLSISVLNSIIFRNKVRIHTIMIGGDNPSLKAISTSYMSAVRLSSEEVLKVVDSIERSPREAKPYKF